MKLHHILLVAILFFSFTTASLSAEKRAERINILIIHSWHQDLPWSVDFDSAFLKRLKGAGRRGVRFYREFMDVGRFSYDERLPHFKKYISTKYDGIDVDYVVADNKAATVFVSNNLGLFGDAKKILYQSPSKGKEVKAPARDDVVSIIMKPDVYRCILEANRIARPSNIYIVIDNNSYNDAVRLRQAEKAIDDLGVAATFLIDKPLKETLEVLSDLPDDSIIVYLLTFKGVDGGYATPRSILSKIVKVADAPIFSHWETLMGTGIVGGHMISGRGEGRLAADIIIKNMAGKPVASSYKSSNLDVYDHELMLKWGLDVHRLPSEANVINIVESPFSIYKNEITVSVVSVVVVTMLFLLFYRFKVMQTTNTKLEQLSLTDPLTGLSNRRGIEQVIYKEMERCKRFDEPVSIIVIDLDFFKAVNDKFGHQVGDNVLKYVADLLKNNIREVDSLARWGGEEFLILTASTNKSQAGILADTILNELRNNPMAEVGVVTASLGIAEYRLGESFDEWFMRADAALYNAKSSGRDQASISGF